MECHNCKRSLPWALHGRDGCHYHSGILQPISRTGCEDMDVDATFNDYFESRRWTCCNQVGSNPGCHWGRHQLGHQSVTPSFHGVAARGTGFPSARGLKRRTRDDDESDSSLDERFSGRSSAMAQAAVYRTMSTGLGTKLRRIDRASLGMRTPGSMGLFNSGPGQPNSSFFTVPSQS